MVSSGGLDHNLLLADWCKGGINKAHTFLLLWLKTKKIGFTWFMFDMTVLWTIRFTGIWEQFEKVASIRSRLKTLSEFIISYENHVSEVCLGFTFYVNVWLKRTDYFSLLCFSFITEVTQRSHEDMFYFGSYEKRDEALGSKEGKNMNSVNSCMGRTEATLVRNVLVKLCDRVGVSSLVKPKTVDSRNNIILIGTN